jgi:VRR-NUC domain
MRQATKTPLPTEHATQAALFDWAGLMIRAFPELGVLYAIPNGGKRSIGAARYMRREGMRAGVPDVCLPVCRGTHGALYIEHKRPPNKLTDDQRYWLRTLSTFGNVAIVSFSFEQSRQAILHYLSLRSGESFHSGAALHGES